ncbi:MAG: hypothetical protein EBU97_02905, partial [Rhodobacteraceae bacterium]|nr:hypothetical protein [Paracoccaceae bacterium]
SPTVTRLHARAVELESVFLSDMLQKAGLGTAAQGAFSGGEGEDHVASFLADAVARAMAARGGIGLAELFFRAMTDAPAGPAETTDGR